jgi:hypothetical protein
MLTRERYDEMERSEEMVLRVCKLAMKLFQSLLVFGREPV